MTKKQQIQIFEDKRVRTAWDDHEEKWSFSIVDVCGALTDNDYQTARKYWKTANKREEDQTCLSYLEREQARRSQRLTGIGQLLEQ